MLGLRAAKHQPFGGLLMRNACLLAFLVLLSASAWAQTSGKQLFDIHCARCHGIGGTGGEGPSLTRLVLRHAGDDEALSSVIVNGIPNSDMPGNWMVIVYRSGLTKGTGVLSGARRIDVTMSITRIPL